jgi:hypothetical protein
MEALVVFIIQSIGSGVIGHYLTKQLSKIDKDLPALFEKGNKEEIRRFIEHKGIGNDVAYLASDTLKRSFVIPPLLEKDATFEDRVELFVHIVRFGFDFSRSINSDLLLPGSIMGPEFFTMFADNGNGAPTVEREGVVLKIKPKSSITNKMYIIPFADQKNKEDILTKYIEKISEYRAEMGDKEYLNYPPQEIEPGADRCNINEISAISCNFSWGTILEPSFKQRFGISEGSKKARIRDWNSGISNMLNYVSSFPRLNSLPVYEVDIIKKLYKDLEKVYQSS